MYEVTDLGEHVYRAHHNLVNVTVFDELDVFHETVLKAGPHLAAQLGINVQFLTQVTHSDAC
jgi:hypothetical protein